MPNNKLLLVCNKADIADINLIAEGLNKAGYVSSVFQFEKKEEIDDQLKLSVLSNDIAIMFISFDSLSKEMFYYGSNKLDELINDKTILYVTLGGEVADLEAELKDADVDDTINVLAFNYLIKLKEANPLTQMSLNVEGIKSALVQNEIMPDEALLNKKKIKLSGSGEKEEETADEIIDDDYDKTVDEFYLSEAYDKYEAEEYKEAFELFTKTQGHNKAMEFLGYMYSEGIGTKEDKEEGFKWYLRAYANGNTDVLIPLADAYYYELGTKKNDRLALKYYLLANKKEPLNQTLRIHVANIYYYGSIDVRNYGHALKMYTQLQSVKRPYVYYNLGYMYNNGFGVKQNSETAFGFLKKAAELEYAPAINDLANMYRDGIGTDRNYAEAFKLYTKAAKLGESAAYKNIGDCYYDGICIKQDKEQGLKYYKKASNMGNGDASYQIGKLYETGTGLDINQDLALRWYNLSAKQESALGALELARHYYFGYNVEKSSAESLKWYKAAANFGSSEATYQVAICYKTGLGTDINYEQALKWFKYGADENNTEALIELGNMYRDGLGTEQNKQEALKNYKKAGDLGNPLGYVIIGDEYLYGVGINKSYPDALKYYGFAENSSFPLAYTRLGDCYFYGYGVTQDYKTAVTYYKKAAKEKEPHSYYMLGRAYELGLGVAQSQKDTLKYYKLAADEKDPDALYSLGDYYASIGDNKKAFEYFDDSAALNYTPAMVRLAMCYFDGVGCDPDKDYSYILGKKAKDLGNPDAAEFLQHYFNEE